MFKSKFKSLIILCFAAMLGHGVMIASETGDEPPVDVPLKLTEDPPEPSKPKAPSRVRISAYRNGDVLVIRSTVNVTAEIQIIDLNSGAACFEGSVFLAPELQFPLPPTGSPVAIRIAVGGSIYEGVYS